MDKWKQDEYLTLLLHNAYSATGLESRIFILEHIFKIFKFIKMHAPFWTSRILQSIDVH